MENIFNKSQFLNLVFFSLTRQKVRKGVEMWGLKEENAIMVWYQCVCICSVIKTSRTRWPTTKRI